MQRELSLKAGVGTGHQMEQEGESRAQPYGQEGRTNGPGALERKGWEPQAQMHSGYSLEAKPLCSSSQQLPTLSWAVLSPHGFSGGYTALNHFK